MSGRYEVRWDRSGAVTAEDLRRAPERGEGLASIAAYGPKGDLRYATVWRPRAHAPALRFEPDVEPARAAAVLARHAREGFHPVNVAMAGSPPVLAFVLEHIPAGQATPKFVAPGPVAAIDARAAEEAGDAGVLVALAAAGGLAAGVWAPQPPVRVAWRVLVDTVDDSVRAWRDDPRPRALETAARPVQAIPIDEEGGRRRVLSLWHDRLVDPWPAEDPLVYGPRFAIDEAEGAAAAAQAAEARRTPENRRVTAIGAGAGGRFMVLYGAPGREEPLRRRFVAVGPGEAAPACVAPDQGDEAPACDHPLDRWALAHMRETGARHGQMAVVRCGRIVFARAYTFAEAGYPVAQLDHAMRLGSVSKALTAIALLRAVARAALPLGLDTPAADLLDLPPGAGPPMIRRVTLRHLLTHQSGLRTFANLDPREPGHPLAEDALEGAPGPARPGAIRTTMAALRDDRAWATPPGREDYSNEGFILLGEILARLACGRFDAYEKAMIAEVFGPAGVLTDGRGCLLGAGRTRARARGESPAHSLRPAAMAKRFAGDDLDPGSIALAPYDANGPFLGGAAGLCVPLLWVARVLAAMGGSVIWTREQADAAAAPAEPGSTTAHGFHLGEPGFWTFSGGGAPLTLRMRRLCHEGRIEGGASLLIHLTPADADAGSDASLGVAVAFNQLGPLHDTPHGSRILAILRDLEGSAGWGSGP